MQMAGVLSQTAFPDWILCISGVSLLTSAARKRGMWFCAIVAVEMFATCVGLELKLGIDMH
jgi:hypothetical protein